MKVHRDINNLPSFKNAAITIGTFDGVHSGHLQIIHQLKKEASLNNGESVIISFYPHPRMVLNPHKKQPPIKLLNTLSEKIELLSKQEIDHLVIVPFTQEFSNQSAEEYIEGFLVTNFHPKTIITGYDHRFGKNRTGDYKLLEKYQDKFNYTVKEIPAQVLDNITISSTKIRQALTEGDIRTANECLGYNYFFEGKIIDGNKLGKGLGYPTANISIPDPHKLIPAYGVYAVTADLGEVSRNPEGIFKALEHYKGMMNIGIRPTIGDGKIMIEVNIFDFNEDIYGRTLRVHIKQYMRPEIKYNNLEELIVQLGKDKTEAGKILNAP
ncbi:MAG: bifunctional riboflavin kinase/FAD synthetase [Ginsengibacter sp.]